MAGRVRLPRLPNGWRAVPFRQPARGSALPQVPPRRWPHGRNNHGAHPYAIERVVLGRLSGRQPAPGMSAVQFPRQIGLSRYETAFQILHKLRAGMVRPDQDGIGGTLGEHVEVDEGYIGGRTRGKGRGVTDQVLVASAVEVRQRKPGTKLDKRKRGRYAGRVRLAIVPDRSADALCGFVESAVAAGTSVTTDDWSGYVSLGKRGYQHLAVAERGDPKVAEEYLPIVHLVFSNLKTKMLVADAVMDAGQPGAYLNEFTFRFNRRFYPFNAFRSLLGVAGAVTAPTYAELYSGEWQHPRCSGYG